MTTAVSRAVGRLPGVSGGWLIAIAAALQLAACRQEPPRDARTDTNTRADVPPIPDTVCLASGRSVLARAPDSPAPGPADLRGWIRLDSVAGASAGPARLIDSDGGSLGASWRRIAGDSLVVIGFDDFLRVEMRLAWRGDSAVGSAVASSDAALERDSTGASRDFRREWRVVARRAACTDAPRPHRA